MGWSAVILFLIELFGPALVEWLLRWLDNRLVMAATLLPSPTSYPTEADARAALFDQAIDSLPRFAFARRTLLRVLRDIAVRGGPLTPEDGAAVRDAGRAAEEE